jgi:dTDP-4-dehydrorhamnose reductase
MRVLVIGASGLVGGNCQRYLQQFAGYQVLGTHVAFPTPTSLYYNPGEPGIGSDPQLIDFQSQVVVHCGALTFVDYCEQHEEESYQKTVASTAAALQLAARQQAKFVYVSTDYVFDGEHGPYTEDDLVNPICVYGRHKLEAEQLVANSGLPYLILRITNVYGDEPRGKNFVSRLLEQIVANQPISLTLPTDQYATPINAFDVARALKMLLDHDRQGIYHLGSTDYMNRLQLAERIVKSFAYADVSLTASSTAALGQVAPRPLRGGLLAHKLLREFPEFAFSNIDDYLINKKYVS